MSVTGGGSPRTRVFISYSHSDKVWLERLKEQLMALEDKGILDVWDDGRIESGAVWRDEIQRALDQTRIAILLVSSSFLGSTFIRKKELPPLLEAARSGGATIIPLIVRPCLFEETPSLSQFQASNAPSRALSGLSEHDQEVELARVARRVLKILENP